MAAVTATSGPTPHLPEPIPTQLKRAISDVAEWDDNQKFAYANAAHAVLDCAKKERFLKSEYYPKQTISKKLIEVITFVVLIPIRAIGVLIFEGFYDLGKSHDISKWARQTNARYENHIANEKCQAHQPYQECTRQLKNSQVNEADISMFTERIYSQTSYQLKVQGIAKILIGIASHLLIVGLLLTYASHPTGEALNFSASAIGGCGLICAIYARINLDLTRSNNAMSCDEIMRRMTEAFVQIEKVPMFYMAWKEGTFQKIVVYPS